MKTSLLPLAMLLASIAGFAMPSEGVAGPDNARLSAQQRGEMISRFVMKWGVYVEATYGTDARTWAMRLVPQFAKGDAANLRRALGRGTYEGAMAELDGIGRRLSDAQIIDRFARMDTRKVVKPGDIALKVLGDAEADLVYTPIQPCRIIDTRSTVAGQIAANSTRSFSVRGLANYTSQGGSLTDCGLQNESPAAMAMNVTAVLPSIAGYATVFPYNSSQPLTSSVNYSAGAIVNNAIISKLAPGAPAFDISIYSFAAAHYVVDVVGYFDTPKATALECTETFITQSVSASNNFDIRVPDCPATHTMTGAGCRSGGFGEAEWAINGLFKHSSLGVIAYCAGVNKTTGSITIEGTARCCRVPGR